MSRHLDARELLLAIGGVDTVISDYNLRPCDPLRLVRSTVHEALEDGDITVGAHSGPCWTLTLDVETVVQAVHARLAQFMVVQADRLARRERAVLIPTLDTLSLLSAALRVAP